MMFKKRANKIIAIAASVMILFVFNAIFCTAAVATPDEAVASRPYQWVLHEGSLYNWIKTGTVTHCDITRGKSNTFYKISVAADGWSGIIDVSPKEYASVNEGDTVTVSSYSTSEYKQLVLAPKTACFYVDAIKSGKDYYALFMKDGELISVKTRHDIGGYGNPLGKDTTLITTENGEFEIDGYRDSEKKETLIILFIVLLFAVIVGVPMILVGKYYG